MDDFLECVEESLRSIEDAQAWLRDYKLTAEEMHAKNDIQGFADAISKLDQARKMIEEARAPYINATSKDWD